MRRITRAQHRENAFLTGHESVSPIRGFLKPLGLFSPEEEEKAYHKMHPHIPGEDGRCVYTFCRKLPSHSDLDIALEASDRYGDLFGSNLINLDANRVRLQDEENNRITENLIPRPPARISICCPEPTCGPNFRV